MERNFDSEKGLSTEQEAKSLLQGLMSFLRSSFKQNADDFDEIASINARTNERLKSSLLKTRKTLSRYNM